MNSVTSNQTYLDKRIETFKFHYIQEYLRGIRPTLIVEAISKKYIVAPQTIRDNIRPETLKEEIRAGKHKIDPNYQ